MSSQKLIIIRSYPSFFNLTKLFIQFPTKKHQTNVKLQNIFYYLVLSESGIVQIIKKIVLHVYWKKKIRFFSKQVVRINWAKLLSNFYIYIMSNLGIAETISIKNYHCNHSEYHDVVSPFISLMNEHIVFGRIFMHTR